MVRSQVLTSALAASAAEVQFFPAHSVCNAQWPALRMPRHAPPRSRAWGEQRPPVHGGGQ